MNMRLVSALRESCGYLQDQGWHQTARLMTSAAEEIERLNERLRELEAAAEPNHRGGVRSISSGASLRSDSR